VKGVCNAVETYVFLWTQRALSAQEPKTVFVNYQTCAVKVFVYLTLIRCAACRVVRQLVLFRTAVSQPVNKFREIYLCQTCIKGISQLLQGGESGSK
jgi:hypothetical protein